MRSPNTSSHWFHHCRVVMFPILKREAWTGPLVTTGWIRRHQHRYMHDLLTFITAVKDLAFKSCFNFTMWETSLTLFKDDAANHTDHQDPISLAVEMAAVNHSILALSQPGSVAGEIKTEAIDDDWGRAAEGCVCVAVDQNNALISSF